MPTEQTKQPIDGRPQDTPLPPERSGRSGQGARPAAEALEPLDEASLDRVMRDCPL